MDWQRLWRRGTREVQRCLILLTFGVVFSVHAEPVRVEAVEAELVSESSVVVPGQKVLIGLRLRHDRHWHTYWRNPGDSGLATAIQWTLPDGVSVSELRWPKPGTIAIGPLVNYGYEDEVMLPMTLSIPNASPTGLALTLKANVSWLMCKDVCIPGEAALNLTVNVGAASQDSPHAARLREFESALPHFEPSFSLKAYQAEQGLVLHQTNADESKWTGGVQWFPYQEGLINHAAAQVASKTQTGMRLDIPWSPDFTKAMVSKPLRGLWVFADGRAAEVEADWSAVSPDPAVTEVGRNVSPSAQRVGGLLAAAGGAAASPEPATPSPVPAGGASLSLVYALVFAFLGGLILNLMPCVFPVAGLKVLSFLQQKDGRALTYAGVFVLGIVLSFVVLAAVMLGLRSAGEAIGWGFQLQSPVFVGVMFLLFVLIGLNLAGVFEVGLGVAAVAGTADRGRGLGGAFGSGVLATLVATPCTAPYMGAALGYTLAAPAYQSLLIFAAVGLGMGAPYLVLAASPGLVKRLPKPGAWMEALKQFLAFPMFATCAWLAWVYTQQVGADGLFRLLLAGVLLALAAWIYGRYFQLKRQRLAAVFVLALGVLSVLFILPSDESRSVEGSPSATQQRSSVWQAWSEASVAQAQAQGRVVFVDFTAAWCVSCQANKFAALNREAVLERLTRDGVVALRADWTDRNETIAKALAKFGRNGVPLYLVYPAQGGAPEILPEILTVDTVLSALDRAKAP